MSITGLLHGTLAQHATVRGLPLPLRGWAFPFRFNGTFEMYPQNTVNFNPTFDESCQDADAGAARGIASLKWAYCWNYPAEGPCRKADPSCTGKSCAVANATTCSEEFASEAMVDHTKWSAAVRGRGLDECNKDNAQFSQARELAAQGYREARRRQPETLIAGWGANTGDEIFASLMHDGTLDLAMIEGYTYCAGCGDWPASGDCCPVGPIRHWQAYQGRLDYAKEQGYLNRTVFTFGFILGQSAINPNGWSRASLRDAMVSLKAAVGLRDPNPRAPPLVDTPLDSSHPRCAVSGARGRYHVRHAAAQRLCQRVEREHRRDRPGDARPDQGRGRADARALSAARHGLRAYN